MIDPRIALIVLALAGAGWLGGKAVHGIGRAAHAAARPFHRHKPAAPANTDVEDSGPDPKPHKPE